MKSSFFVKVFCLLFILTGCGPKIPQNITFNNNQPLWSWSGLWSATGGLSLHLSQTGYRVVGNGSNAIGWAIKLEGEVTGNQMMGTITTRSPGSGYMDKNGGTFMDSSDVVQTLNLTMSDDGKYAKGNLAGSFGINVDSEWERTSVARALSDETGVPNTQMMLANPPGTNSVNSPSLSEMLAPPSSVMPNGAQAYSTSTEYQPTDTLASIDSSERRIALVVGNSRYRSLPRLDNPSNDARLIATTLAKLGFKIIGGNGLVDLDKANFENAIKTFSDAMQQIDSSSYSGQKSSVVALFYYAGHGIQARGENYLIPIDANPTKESDFDFQLISANLVLRQMESAGTALNMVILDACRNNPIGGRGLRSSGNGLVEMKAPEGTLIAFATQSGNVALDGPSGGNSPFAQALAWGIQKPDLDQFGTFNEVALRVKKQTNGAQQPWMSNSPIEGRFSFVPRRQKN